MKESNLYDGTLWQLVENFTGPYYDPAPTHELLINEEELRPMTELEQRLYSLWQMKLDELSELSLTICGRTTRGVESNEVMSRIEKLMHDLATPFQRTLRDMLIVQSEFFQKSMWNFIFSTVLQSRPVPGTVVAIRPGCKIVVGQKASYTPSDYFNSNRGLSKQCLS